MEYRDVFEMCQRVQKDLHRQYWTGEGFGEYFVDGVEDIKYTVDVDLGYRSVRFAVTGSDVPVYVDTDEGVVDASCVGETVSVWLPRHVCDEIDAVFERAYYTARR